MAKKIKQFTQFQLPTPEIRGIESFFNVGGSSGGVSGGGEVFLQAGEFKSPNFVKKLKGWMLENTGKVWLQELYAGDTSNYLSYDKANGLQVVGKITATTGEIGGFTIGATTISSASNEIILDSDAKKITVGTANKIFLDGENQRLQSDNYVSGAMGAGFHLSDELLEVGNIACRGLIRTAVFQKDIINVMGGNFLVLDGDVLDEDMTALDASTLKTKGVTTFSVGDILRIKDGTNDEWLEVKSDIIDSYSESNLNGYVMVTGSAGYLERMGQSFTAIAGTLDSCKFHIKKGGLPTGNIIVELYAHTGTYGSTGKPTGAVLATSDNVDISTLTTSGQNITFNFSGANRISLVNGTKYCIAVKYTDGDGSNYLAVAQDSASPTHSGNKCYLWTGGAWGYTSGSDVCFYVYTLDNPYSVTRDKNSQYTANTNPAWKKGATVVNYGQSGDGGVYMTASESNAPYLSVFEHSGSPWTDLSTKLRIGNLNGYLEYSSDLYGIGIGATDNSLTYDPTNGLRITGTITAGVVKTDVAGNARIELTKTSNRISIYNSSDNLLGYLGNAGAGSFLYINYLSGESGNPINISNANSSETLKINDTHATKAINAVLIQSASVNASTLYLSNSANYRTLTIAGSSASYPTQYISNSGSNITLYTVNTGANRALLASSNSNAGVNTTGCAIQAHQTGTSSIYGTNVAGCYCSKAGVWTDASSKKCKENFEDIKVLDIIKNLDIKKYNYISEKRQTKKQIEKYLKDTKQKKIKIKEEYSRELKRPVPKHFSPMAEDFYAMFGLGDDKGMSGKDVASVALQGIKEVSIEIDKLKKIIYAKRN